MTIETVPIERLMTDPDNARRHPVRNLTAIAKSLQKFGQQKPIVIDGKNVVRAGNGTLAAARSLGWKEIKAIRTELDGADLAAYAIADNRSAELADWDDDKLSEELRRLTEIGFSHADLGFETNDLKSLIEDDVQMRAMSARPYPKMSWALIGIPTVHFGRIAATVEQIATIPETIVHTSVNDREDIPT